jgi:hypothetical protein
VQDLARFAVLYMQDKNRGRKQVKFEKKRALRKAEMRKEEMEQRRRVALEEKKKRKMQKDQDKKHIQPQG